NVKQNLIGRLLNFVNPAVNDPNRDSTDFLKALSEIYAMINKDIAESRNDTINAAETRGRYSVIFLSDGHPTNNQDDEVLCGDAVTRIRQLKDLAEDVRFNSVFVFTPLQPVSSACDLTGYIPPAGGSGCRIAQIPGGACQMLMVNQDSERLERMAALGGGDFRDFRNNEPVNF